LIGSGATTGSDTEGSGSGSVGVDDSVSDIIYYEFRKKKYQ